MRPKESTQLPTFPRPIEHNDNAIDNTPPVPTAENVVPADEPFHVCYEISEITKPDAPSKSNSLAPYTDVMIARSISLSTSPTLPPPARTIRIVLLTWQYVSLWRMALPIEMPVGDSGEIIEFLFPLPPYRNGLRQQGKKTYTNIETDDYFDWAFGNFSGYIAIDEVYDGPFCILSLVDNREYKRLMYRVLNHAPSAEDILELLRAFQKILERRELKLSGITTDGSALYTEPVRIVFPGVRHQICEFHVKKEVNAAVLKAVAQVRRELDKTKIKRQKRGRPSTKEEKAAIRKNKRIQAKIGALFEHRYLFVQKEFSAKERKTLQTMTRGLPELRKLREIVEEVYRLYDRRCRRQTALQKLKRLRERLKRFKRLSLVLKKIESPTLDRSLHFLDDKKLPSTSNAVERGNRRFRKMQKSVYKVRTCEHIEQRIALDMVRDRRCRPRCRAIKTLHHQRAG
jgi:hypothetical protein